MRKTLLLFVTTACLAAPSTAQPASYTTFGQACGGLAGDPPTMPQISATGLPRLGMYFTVHYQAPRFNCNYSVGAVLATGISRTSLGNARLPWRVPPLGSPLLGGANCFLLCSGEALQVQRGAPPSITFFVPNNPTLLGLTLYQQWWLHYLVACPSSILYFLFLTDGGIMTIGV